jgi:hypothetical protein
MKQNGLFLLKLLALIIVATELFGLSISFAGGSGKNPSLAGVWISRGENMTIPSTGRHAKYFVEYEFRADGTYRNTDYTVYDDGSLVEGSKTYSLSDGIYRVTNNRLFYTPRGAGEQEYGVALEAGLLKLSTPTSVQVFQRKNGRFAE